jgi:anti-anti-sigma factor
MSLRHDASNPSGGLEVFSSEYEGVPLIHLAGELDSATFRSFYNALDDALAGTASVVLIDFSSLAYLDSAGLNVLFDAMRSLSQRGWMGAIGPNQVVRKLLDMGGLTSHPCFRVFEDLDSVILD